MKIESAASEASRNACKLCAPLGACLAFKGIAGCIPFLHGSQGCATYIRRYLIGHYKEPVDIASSSFSETSAIYGGEANLAAGLKNVIQQYRPSMIGIASTCLSETIGDDVPFYLNRFKSGAESDSLPGIAYASTPSYRGTHAEGFYTALRSIVECLAEGNGADEHTNVISSLLSPADLRYIKEIFQDFDLPLVLLPDYSDTLDGPVWEEYLPIPPGGTSQADIRSMGRARATLEMGETTETYATAGQWLYGSFHVPLHSLPLPIGIKRSDRFFQLLEIFSGKPMPPKHALERGRLIDALVDGHKYVFEKRAVIYGEEDFVSGIAALVSELGMKPVLCASGGRSGKMESMIHSAVSETCEDVQICSGADFQKIQEEALRLQPDILIGNSKGYKLARELNIPLVRVGFPIHDRLGGSRILHIGYRGAHSLFDAIANALIDSKQSRSPAGYFYM